ncbi:MAG TPA: hypothetical protein ENN34_04345 [Deltaproteobacteria bacterium]|nr:hypothetical protein [Deltaproteobacteria bacterium]
MNAVPSPKLILLVLILLITVQSCAETRTRTQQTGSVQTTDHVTPPSETPRHVPDHMIYLAKNHMEAGEYQKAFDLYRKESQKHPDNLPLVKEHVTSIEQIRAMADTAFEKNDFASSGKLYYVLLNNYATFATVAQLLSFDSDFLNTRLSSCRKSLSVQGFQEYRNGNLETALEYWNSLLVIDPDNRDIQEIVRTATVQQKNLQEED